MYCYVQYLTDKTKEIKHSSCFANFVLSKSKFHRYHVFWSKNEDMTPASYISLYGEIPYPEKDKKLRAGVDHGYYEAILLRTAGKKRL